MVTIYLICQECDDPFYKPHPTDIAFTTLAEAKQYIRLHHEDEFEYYSCSIKTITLVGVETPRLSERVYWELIYTVDRIHVDQADRDALDAIKRLAFDLLS